MATSEIQSRDNPLPADSVGRVEEDSAEARAEVREYSCSVAEAGAGEVLRTGHKAWEHYGARND